MAPFRWRGGDKRRQEEGDRKPTRRNKEFNKGRSTAGLLVSII